MALDVARPVPGLAYLPTGSAGAADRTLATSYPAIVYNHWP